MSSARSARCSFLLAIIALITFSSASHLFSVADEPNCYSPNPIQFDCASAPTTFDDDVIEGRVAPASTQPNDWLGHTRDVHAAVAIDDSNVYGLVREFCLAPTSAGIPSRVARRQGSLASWEGNPIKIRARKDSHTSMLQCTR